MPSRAVQAIPVPFGTGVETADDAWERIAAGATLVQAYTGFIYGGPGAPTRIARELVALR